MRCSRSSYASGDACEANLVHRPCVPCVAFSFSPLTLWWSGLEDTRLILRSLIDRRYRLSKVICASRENNGTLRAPRGIIRHHRPPRGRTRLPRDEPIRRIVQNVLQERRRRGPARSMEKVCGLFSCVNMRPLLLTVEIADLLRESGHLPIFQTRYQIYLRCSRPGAIER